jgi:hypothetical protein
MAPRALPVRRPEVSCRLVVIDQRLVSLEGRLIGQWMPRKRRQESIRFLKQIDAETTPQLDLRLFADNYAHHRLTDVNTRLKRHSVARKQAMLGWRSTFTPA